MKKVFSLAAVAALTASAFAQETVDFTVADDEVAAADFEPQRKKVAAWPVCIALCELPETPDMVGLRLTIPFSTKQESVTGFDVGFWGRARYFEGGQFNILRNDVKDTLAGVQVGLYNSAGEAQLFGVQAGLWNEAGALSGAQVGAINVVGQMEGFQVGIINRAEDLHGCQVGLVNVIRGGQIPFCPIVNIGF